MPRLCSSLSCTTLLSREPAYYCCSPSLRYCGRCRFKNCSKCGRQPDRMLIPTICSMCDGDQILQTCACDVIICKACCILSPTCKICGKLYQPYVKDAKVLGSSPKTICDKCERTLAYCTCKGSGNPSPIKKAQIQECSKCFRKEQVSNMFCNLCGHFYCKQCLMDNTLDKCPEFRCRSVYIDRAMVSQFLGTSLCLVCQQPLPDQLELRYGPDKNVCPKCKEAVIDEPPTVILSEPEKSQVLKSSPNRLQVPKGSAINKENVGSSAGDRITDIKIPQAPKSPKNNGGLPPRGPSKLENSLLQTPNREASRVSATARTPQKSLRTPSANKSPMSAVRDSPSGETRTKSKSNASMIDPSAPTPCLLCNIQYLPRQLLSINCANKHKMCHYCAIVCRGNKCEVCKKMQQDHLDKYFCYKELTSDDKVGFNQKLQEQGYALCVACSIVVEKSRIINEKGKTYCRSCLIKLK